MNDVRLRVFCAVAQNLSFTKASKELFMSQPAVTKHINKLESDFGVRLFERNGQKISLTVAGKIMLEKCRVLLKDYEDLNYAINQFKGEEAGKLSLGASTSISQYVLPGILADFASLYPHIELSLLNGNSVTIEQAVSEQIIDLGMVENVNHAPNLHVTPFLKDRLLLCCGKDTPLKSTLTVEELKRVPLVLREHGSGTLDAIRQILEQHNEKLSDFKIKLFLGSTEAIKRFLQHSDAAGIVSQYAVAEELKRGELKKIALEGVNFERNFSVVSAQGPLSPLSERFFFFLQQSLLKPKTHSS